MITQSVSLPIRVFIGSSPKNLIEEQVFCHTLLKNISQSLEIYSIDGTTGSATCLNTREVKTLPPEVLPRISGQTAFSLARWAIPEWCNYQGRAIYCDSDQLCLADMAELWNSDLSGSTIAAVSLKQARSHKHYIETFMSEFYKSSEDYYLASVMLLDCEKVTWRLESLIDLIEQNVFSRSNLMFVGSDFRTYFNLKVTPLAPEWNHLDCATSQSKIVHFTDTTRQPWLFHHHPLTPFWEQFYLSAIQEGYLSLETIRKSYEKGWITHRTYAIAQMNPMLRSIINPFWRAWNACGNLLAEAISKQIQQAKALRSRFSTRLNPTHNS
ncbi:MAG: hypothetical protein KME10_10635 [Plectolyngbya sp. WJT66-NPBG17]|jgi:lipopolysaccharide biosynthesis glycosyltransferase|nr:hypothetical protein [Plectolyngbya sp. WJT66-NPBG17]